MNKKALESLHKLKELNGKHKYVVCTDDEALIDPRNFDSMFRGMLERCGIEKCGVHALRHTFASMMFKKGADVKAVSAILGHSNVGITYNTYIHLIKEQKHEAVALLDDL